LSAAVPSAAMLVSVESSGCFASSAACKSVCADSVPVMLLHAVETVEDNVVPVIAKPLPMVISCASPEPLSPRPSSFEAADTFCILA